MFLLLGNEQRKFEQKEGQGEMTIPHVSFLAPSFELSNLHSEQFLYRDDVEGEVVFLNFWASWCSPCQAEMPALVEMAKRYEGKVTFIGVNTTYQDRKDRAQQLIEQFHVPYENVFDEDGKVSNKYEIAATPTSFVIDQQGKIVYRRLGGMTKQEIIYAIEKALREEK